MEGLARASGAPVPVTIGGRKMLLRGLGLEDYGTIEQRLLAEKQEDPIEAIGPHLEGLSRYPGLQSYVLDRFYTELRKKPDAPTRISEQEIMAYLMTFEGRVYSLYLSLRQEQPDLTEDDARKLIEEDMRINGAKALEKLAQRLEQASGLDLAGNSIGRPAQHAAERPETRSPSPGDGIIESLPNGSTGLPLS